MNYLAHAYLSFNHPGVLVGNMISDFVKGNNRFNYPPTIQAGIMLHRAIDQYTDEHPVVKEAKSIFRPAYRLYSGAIMDVLFDHFLANDRTVFSTESLEQFAGETYEVLEANAQWQPPRFATMFPYMQSQNWLFNCRTKTGIGNSLRGLVRRAQYMPSSDEAFNLFETHFQLLDGLYRQFWKDLHSYAQEQFNNLTTSATD